MPKIEYGAEASGLPNGDRASLERLAAQVNERARQEWLAKVKMAEEAKKSRENKSQSNY